MSKARWLGAPRARARASDRVTWRIPQAAIRPSCAPRSSMDRIHAVLQICRAMCAQRLGVQCQRPCFQKHMRAMPHPPAQNTCTGVTVMNWENQNEDIGDGVGAWLDFLKSLNENGSLPHMLKLWEGAVCMVMRKIIRIVYLSIPIRHQPRHSRDERHNEGLSRAIPSPFV